MSPTFYIAQFFAGAFLCNSLPHLAAGLQGRAFPTPFARPRGVGRSTALVNVVWGLFNLAVGLLLLAAAPVPVGLNPSFVIALLGALLLGCYLALRFGRLDDRG